MLIAAAVPLFADSRVLPADKDGLLFRYQAYNTSG